MEWYVYYENINRRTIEKYNIFDHYMFTQECVKALENNPTDRNAFAEAIKHELMFYFWSKCEYEVLITSWLHPLARKETCLKIDVYEQVMLNFTQFIDYLWSHQSELKKLKGE